MGRKKKHASGPSKTYAERVASGRAPVFVWLSSDAAGALDELIARGMSKTEAIEAGLMMLRESGDDAVAPRTETPPVPPIDSRTHRPRGERAQPPGSPAELAARVRSAGARRKAVEVG